MKEEFYKKSRITGKTYEMSSIIRILNVKQAAFYMMHGLELQDVVVSSDRNTGEPILVFYFVREKTKEVFDLWCNRNQE